MLYFTLKEVLILIIDIHTHIGKIADFYDMPIEKQLFSMEKYKIDYALISDITCGECYTKAEIGKDFQYLINKNAIEIAKKHRDKIGVLLWCRANAEGFNSDFLKLYLENKDIVKGLKIHPDIASLPPYDEKYFPYYEMAKEYNLPVLFHTKESEFSKVSYVETAAEEFPKVNFIIGHMSLGDEKTSSINLLKNYPNIYGDTAWVEYRDVIKMCEQGLSDKILFGTDSPIAGENTYGDEKFYLPYYKNKDALLEKVLYKNAKKLFDL